MKIRHSHWRNVTLGDLAEYINGAAFKPQDWEEVGTPIIRIQNLTDPAKPLNRTKRIVSERLRVQNDDILVSWSATLDAFIWQRGEAWLNQHIFRVLPNEHLVDKGFLFFLLKREIARLIETEHLHGSTMKHINRGPFLAHKILLPPLDEQRRIVAKLNSLFARSRVAREELAHVPRLVEHYRQSTLLAAFTGKISADWRAANSDAEEAAALVGRTPKPAQPRGGREAAERIIPGVAALSVNHPQTPSPKGWAWTPLNRIARQETGHTPSRSHPEWWGGDVPWIGIKDASSHHGQTIHDTFQKTNAAGLANSAARLLPAGTVCLSRTASVGYVAMMGKAMATSQDFVTWTCSEALLPKFLMYALMAEGEEIRRFGKGSTHTTIYFPEVRALHICLPPLAEQQEIVRQIEVAFSQIDRLSEEQNKAAFLIDRLDRATLAKAFSGELVL